MAVKDFKSYYLTVQKQYLEMKNDLNDFNKAFADGHITEDKLTEVKEEINILETNYQRLSYVMYLLEMPRDKHKKAQYARSNKKLEKTFSDLKADANAVILENKSGLDTLRKELKTLVDLDKKKM